MSYAHHVCFDCRKSWSRRFKRLGAARIESDFPLVCPSCKQPLIVLGRFFKPPKQTNARQSKKVWLIVQKGFYFGANGVSVPKTLVDMPAFRHGTKTRGQELAGKFRKKLW